MWFAGFRGAMFFALAVNSTFVFLRMRHGEIMLVLTLLYSTMNIFVFGSILEPVCEKLGIK